MSRKTGLDTILGRAPIPGREISQNNDHTETLRLGIDGSVDAAFRPTLTIKTEGDIWVTLIFVKRNARSVPERGKAIVLPASFRPSKCW